MISLFLSGATRQSMAKNTYQHKHESHVWKQKRPSAIFDMYFLTGLDRSLKIPYVPRNGAKQDVLLRGA